MTPADKKKIVTEFAAKSRSFGNNITEEVSVNHSQGVDAGTLLSGDADEELRMADRLAEKAQNAKEGKMARVTVDDIRPSQRGPLPTGIEEEEKTLLLKPDQSN